MRPWLHLVRISNLPTVWTNVAAAWLLAGGELEDMRLAWLILAGSLLYTGGMILNDAADVKFDREHRPERPIPSGQVSAGTAWSVGISMLAGGATLAVVFGANLWITVALVAAILFYDLYHKPWAGAVIVMGACRTLLYLMSASAAVKEINIVMPQAIALGSYIVGITLAARSEGKVAKASLVTRLLPVVVLSAPILASASHYPRFGGWDGLIYLALGWLLSVPIGFLSKGGPSIGRGVGWLLAGITIVDALAVAAISIPLALVFVALAPLLRFWQRWVAAT